jgi:hypothetical protein
LILFDCKQCNPEKIQWKINLVTECPSTVFFPRHYVVVILLTYFTQSAQADAHKAVPLTLAVVANGDNGIHQGLRHLSGCKRVDLSYQPQSMDTLYLIL